MTRKSKIPLGELFPELDLIGDFSALQSVELNRIALPEGAVAGDLVFIGHESLVPAITKGRASAYVISDSLWDATLAIFTDAPKLRSRDAMLAFAKASAHFRTESTPVEGVHPTAQVHPGAKIGPNVSIGPFAVVEAGAEIGAGVMLHARAHVGERVRIGQDSVLFPGVVVYQDCVLGERVRVHANSVIGADGFGYVQERAAGGVRHVKIHHNGGVTIGNDVEIGASSTIDRGTVGNTVIADGCIIDNQVQIGHNCRIDEGVIICGCTGLAGSVHVEKFAVIAGMVGVGNKIRIGAGARIAGFSSVTGNVPAGAQWGGVPGMPWRDFKRLQVYIARLPAFFGARKGQEKEQ